MSKYNLNDLPWPVSCWLFFMIVFAMLNSALFMVWIMHILIKGIFS